MDDQEYRGILQQKQDIKMKKHSLNCGMGLWEKVGVNSVMEIVTFMDKGCENCY